MGQKKYDIFISYRRDGGESTAKMLRDQLASIKYRVFFDVESLRSGDFNLALLSVIEGCRDFVLVLSPGALDRCQNENDWVRLEIEHALRNNLNIIPVMLRGFTFPKELPPSIEAIRYRNGLEANYQFFDAFIQRLQTFLLSKPATLPRNKIYLGCAGAMGAMLFLLMIKIAFFPAEAPSSGTPLPTSAPTPARETPAPTEAPTPLADWNPLMADAAPAHGDKFVLGNKDLARSSVRTITFLNTLADMPEGAWDVSYAQKGRSVMAWALPAEKESGTGLFDLYIAADGIIKAQSCEALFAYYDNVTEINFNGCFTTDMSQNMSRMFKGCGSLKTLDISDFNTEKTTNMSAMFSDCNNLNALDFASFRTEEVTDMSNMFVNCQKLTKLDLSGFKTEKVENMYNMFGGCIALQTADLRGFDTSSVKNMRFMFNLCSSLTRLDLSEKFTAASATDMGYMFSQCSYLKDLDLRSFATDSVTDMGSMFNQCSSLAKIYLSDKFTTSQVKDMSFMFNLCNALEEIDVSGFDTGKVTTMKAMFQGCRSLTSLDLSGFDTKEVTDMTGMFGLCNSLSEIRLGSLFNTGKVESMSLMFHHCEPLSSVDLSGFDTGNVQNMSGMFSYCVNLKSLDLSSFVTDNVTDMSDMFKGCGSLKELDLSGFNMSRVTNRDNMFTNAGITAKKAGLPE